MSAGRRPGRTCRATETGAASYKGAAPDSYSDDTGFESLAAHAGVAERQTLHSQKLVGFGPCGFESRGPHSMEDGVIGSTAGSGPAGLGSSPGPPAKPL